MRVHLRPFTAILLLSFARQALADGDARLAVEAVALGRTEIRVYWNPLPGAVKYAISRDGQRIGQVDASDKQFTDSTAAPDKSYSYNVSAINSSGTETAGRPYIERAFDDLPS